VVMDRAKQSVAQPVEEAGFQHVEP